MCPTSTCAWRSIAACPTPSRPEDREALAAELIDRFGPLPPEADQLLKVVAIKGLCRQANVAKIDVGPKGAVVSFRDDRFANPAGLVGLRPEERRRLAPAARPEGGGQGRMGNARAAPGRRRSKIAGAIGRTVRRRGRGDGQAALRNHTKGSGGSLIPAARQHASRQFEIFVTDHQPRRNAPCQSAPAPVSNDARFRSRPPSGPRAGR